MIYLLIKSRIKLFKDIKFLLICLSGFLATFANGLVYITTSWYAYNLYDSITGVAIMMFLIWSPGIVLAPFYGSCADKYNRKWLIVLSLFTRGVSIVLFSIFFMFNINLSIFYLAAIIGLFVAFYMPAVIPLITSIIPKDRFVEANSTIDMLYEIGTVLGMGISGVLIVIFGITGTLFIGGIIFLFSCIAILYLPFIKQPIKEEKKSSLPGMAFLHSLKYLVESTTLIGVYIMQIFVMTILMTVPILLVPYIKEVLEGGGLRHLHFLKLFIL